MEIRSSALEHGVSAEDIRHALNVAVVVLARDEEQTLVLGPDRTGRMLELIVIDAGDEHARVIHAMPKRPSFRPYLPKW